jgi:hypothetical protein
MQGFKYKDLEAVKDEVNPWSISLRRKFWESKCSSYVYDVKCLHEGCPWRVCDSKGRWKTRWICSIIMEHNCSSKVVAKTHRNMPSAFIASEMYVFIVDGINYELKMIIRHIQHTYKYSINFTYMRHPMTTCLECYLELLKGIQEVIMMCITSLILWVVLTLFKGPSFFLVLVSRHSNFVFRLSALMTFLTV